MKTDKWMSLAAVAVTLLLGSSCTHDWGKMDPPAGDQVAPTMQNVASYAFDAEEEIDPLVIQLFAYPDGEIPSLKEDELAQSPVLNLESGYARFNNPLKSVTVQNAVSYTFWMKQISDPVLDEEGNPVEGQVQPQDLTSPIMYWENENASASLKFTPNGWLKYDGLDSKWEQNNPDEYKTGYMTPDEWHYVALIIRDHGYALYVDGQKKADITSSDLNYAGAVQFAAQAPYMYFNYGGDSNTSLLIEDLNVYRNEITSKQIARPKKGIIGAGEGGGGVEAEIMDEVLTNPVLGKEDNSTGWWTVWTPVVRMTGDGTTHYEFTNYSTTQQNYHNWVIVITNGHEREEDGYEEIIVMRADAYGWGAKYGDAKIEHTYNWDTFAKQMDGAKVTVDVTRKGTDLVIASKAITKDGEEMLQTVTVPGVDVEKIGSFFTCEGAHLVFDLDKTFKGKVYPAGTLWVGKEDFSNGFWSCWTEMEKKESDFSRFGFEFVNHSEGDQNYKFWNLVITNGYQSAPDGERDPAYKEWLYLRCDAYGWAELWSGDKVTHGFNWDTYKADMQGATSHIYFSVQGDTFTMIDREETADGRMLPDYKFVSSGIELPIGIIFTGERMWLEIRKIGYFPWAKMD